MPDTEKRDDFAGLLDDRDEDRAGATAASGGRRHRRRSEQRRRAVRHRIIIVVIVVIALIAAGSIGWVVFGDRIGSMFGADDYSGPGNGTEVTFTVQDGDTGTSIGERLAEADIVKTSDAFVAEVVSRDPEPTFMPGTYGMQEQMSAAAAVDALTDASNLQHGSFVVPEGTWMKDIFAIIEDGLGIPLADLEAAAADVASYGLPAEATTLEGFLFPATYEFPPETDASTVLATMVDRSFQSLDAAGVAPEERWDVIRMASLVQREAGLRDDFYKVSRVFFNRLDIGMPLQADSTVHYGVGRDDHVETTEAERVDASNPYNTYVHPGMIVGPISNPGDVAIDAAVNPVDGDWLYFVTWNLETGETIFSTTYEEHLAAVNKWQAWMADHPEYQ
ncbi:ABC transporter substrate-binding protein [Pseudoclavibacter endophyticus]|uniref:Endolytic murein transglycosylase n=1 Tax=Pseudoclavibacter endophyticus TaxID=1778590 RepID=A0A6H9WT15_9MICO|nr:endolytic transglycosylase MltG [Pseudoclavibacter endophyticus]KAB1650077.1 endolytic transglycosylase MltG [Pseudoclavibacter endophyticus]GGA57474.1 ABC transporter substrate-binding protein [Pseudoclavibacter endophyticus]